MKRKRPKLQTLKPSIGTLGNKVQTLSRAHDPGARARKKFYDSARWQDTRTAKLQRDSICQRCKHDGQIVQAVHVDHWHPLAQGGAETTDDNLVSLCLACHGEKTAAEQQGKSAPFKVSPSAVRDVGFA